jgi:hypothetical protein
MENALVLHDPNQSLALQKVADGLFKSGMFPNAKNTFGAYAIVQYGHELGIPPMMALKNINIISGQLACNAQLMLSMAMSRGVTYKVIKETDKGAEIEFKRGDITYVASFTEEDAKAAGLTGKDNWKKYARDMYFWRAAAKGIRRISPDAVLGLYTKDEISNGEIIDVAPQSAKVKTEDLAKKETIVDAVTEEGELPTPPLEEVPPRQADVQPTPEPLGEKQPDPQITEAQRKRFYAMAKGADKSDDQIKEFLRGYIGSESTKDIPRTKYEFLCNEISKKAATP